MPGCWTARRGSSATPYLYLKANSAQAGNTQHEHDTYYGARSNEFGYANYEILLKGPANLVELPKSDDIPNADQSKYLNVPVEKSE